MKKLLLLILILVSGYKLFASVITADSLKQKSEITNNELDSLKQQLQVIIYDSLRAPIYTQMAAYYLKHDTISNKKERLAYQNNIIRSLLVAIRICSRYDDTVDLRTNYYNLARVYHSQKKYTQAKWFVLQSSKLSRTNNDVPNTIKSLVELSTIKSDIKDFKLAKEDLDEALALSIKNHLPHQEAFVQQNYAMLYNRMQDHIKADIALKRHDAIEDSIRKDEEAKLLAKLNTNDSAQQAKKKVLIVDNKKPSKASSSKKTASL